MLKQAFQNALTIAPINFWAIMLAAPLLTLFAVALTLVVWLGGWPDPVAPQQLEILGWALLATLGMLALIMVALTKVKLKASTSTGAGIEIGGQAAQVEPDLGVNAGGDPVLDQLEPRE